MAELTGRTKTTIQTARSPGVRKDFSTRDLIPITTINNNNNNNNSNSIVNNHLEILGTSYCVYTTSTRMKSGSFAKCYCWNRDKNISPKIPRPFPVARTQIVEPVLLLNLKLYTVLVLT